MPRFIVPYKDLNAHSHSFIISITMTFGLLYKIKMTIKVRPPYSWNYSNTLHLREPQSGFCHVRGGLIRRVCNNQALGTS